MINNTSIKQKKITNNNYSYKQYDKKPITKDQLTPENIINILQSKSKSKENLKILSKFLKKNESLMKILQNNSSKSMNSSEEEINMDTIINTLSNQFEYQYLQGNCSLFNYGDIGDKFYFIVKGEVNILIPKEFDMELTSVEYLNYLINLYKLKEVELLSKTIDLNCHKLNLSFEFIELLVNVEKEHMLIEDLVDSKKDKDLPLKNLVSPLIKSSINTPHRTNNLTNPSNFQNQEEQFQRNATKRSSFNSPIQTTHLQQLMTMKRQSSFKFDFKQEETIKSVPRSNKKRLTKFELNKNVKKNEISKLNVEEYCSLIENPGKFLSKLYIIMNRAKSKGYSIGIYEETLVKHNKKQENEKILLRNMTKDEEERYKKSENEEYLREKETYRIYKYLNIKSMKTGDLFGDIALQTTKNKRTATVYVIDQTHLLFLIKDSFDSTIGMINSKILNEKYRFFNRFDILNHYNNQLLYENFYYFFKEVKVSKGQRIITQGEEISKIFFVKSGDFLVYITSSIRKMKENFNLKTDVCERFVLEENNPVFNRFINKIRCFTVKILHSGEFLFVEYSQSKVFKDKDLSYFNIECVSDKGEVFCLEKRDLYNILESYNRLNTNTNSHSHISKGVISNEKDNSSNAISDDKEVPLKLFNFHKETNKIHNSFLKLVKVKRIIMKNRLNSIIDQLFKVFDTLNSRKTLEIDLKERNTNGISNINSISKVNHSINYNLSLSKSKTVNFLTISNSNSKIKHDNNTKLISSLTVRNPIKNSQIHEINTKNDIKDLLISKDLSYKKKIHESFLLNQPFYKTNLNNQQKTKKNVVFLNLNEKHFSSTSIIKANSEDDLKNTENHNKIKGIDKEDTNKEVIDCLIKNTFTFDSVNSLNSKGKSQSNQMMNTNKTEKAKPNFRKSNFISFDLSNLITKTTTFTLSSFPSLPSTTKNKERLLIKSILNKDLSKLTDDEIHFLKTSKNSNLNSNRKSKVFQSFLFNLSNKNLLLKSKVNLNNIVKRRLYEDYL